MTKTETEINALILAHERYEASRLYGALIGQFDPVSDSQASIAFLVTQDAETLGTLAAAREARQGEPVFIEATQVFPPGKEPEMKIRRKGETWNALEIRMETLRSTPGTRAYARAILDSQGDENPFGQFETGSTPKPDQGSGSRHPDFKVIQTSGTFGKGGSQ